MVSVNEMENFYYVYSYQNDHINLYVFYISLYVI